MSVCFLSLQILNAINTKKKKVVEQENEHCAMALLQLMVMTFKWTDLWADGDTKSVICVQRDSQIYNRSHMTFGGQILRVGVMEMWTEINI